MLENYYARKLQMKSSKPSIRQNPVINSTKTKNEKVLHHFKGIDILNIWKISNFMREPGPRTTFLFFK